MANDCYIIFCVYKFSLHGLLWIDGQHYYRYGVRFGELLRNCTSILITVYSFIFPFQMYRRPIPNSIAEGTPRQYTGSSSSICVACAEDDLDRRDCKNG